MSGVTKNVMDWASRPPDDSCVDGKPVGLAGCSSGGFGTVRAKLALLPVLHTKKQLGELLDALAAWARRFRE